jgi:hypothetical protein
MEEHHNLKDEVEDYIDTKIDIIKLKAIDKIASAASGAITGIGLAFLGVFILLFLSISAAFAIAELTGRSSIGFLCIGGFYILLAVILLVFKDQLVTMPVVNSLAKKFYFKEEQQA